MKTPVIVTVQGGIVQNVDSPQELNVLVLDFDKGSDDYLHPIRHHQDPGDWPQVVKNAKKSITAEGENPDEYSDVLNTGKQTPKIDQVKIKHMNDEGPALDYLGEFTDDHDGDDIKRGSLIPHKTGDHGTFNFFRPENSVQEHRAGLSKIGYSKGVAEQMAREYCRQDYKRMMDFENGNICMIGIQATARVSYDLGQGNRRLEWFTSGGLWGIESDSDPKYIKDIEAEELADLKGHLEGFNINVSDWDEKTPETTGEIDEIAYS